MKKLSLVVVVGVVEMYVRFDRGGDVVRRSDIVFSVGRVSLL